MQQQNQRQQLEQNLSAHKIIQLETWNQHIHMLSFKCKFNYKYRVSTFVYNISMQS